MRILFNYMDTRSNSEDFALTPYLFLVKYSGGFKVFGIGICWGWFAFAMNLGLNVPKEVPILMRISENKKSTTKTP